MTRRSSDPAVNQLELLQSDTLSGQALIEETRQLFNHEGSDEELFELVLNTSRILSDLCDAANSAVAHPEVA